MKTRSIIIAAIAMMAIVPTASAQEEIKKAFQEVTDELEGVTKVGEQKTAKVDKDGITVESNVTTIKVERKYQLAVSETLKDAFKKEASKTSIYEEETGNEKLELDSALVHNLGLRRQWSIYRDGAEDILIGSMKNSTYYITNFNDKKHKGYRTCYAAEWSNADNPDVYTARLVYVYGQQPPGSSGIAEAKSLNIMGTASLRNGLPDDLMDRLKGQTKLPDSLFVRSLDSLFNRSSKNVAIGSFALDIPSDIPFDGNMDSWMALVMQRGVSKLSNADWHRFFGLLTQQMMDKGNKESKEDLVVSAGLILDLCKNAPLDDDERKVAANRLLQVSEYFEGDKNQYVFDMIELARKKVEKKK
ncbi:MAG: hypothetical protein K6E52_00490 [Bacteroidaceae bacterium]|nr:hypothetical protein [Bacteroidaceae bacterium]